MIKPRRLPRHLPDPDATLVLPAARAATRLGPRAAFVFAAVVAVGALFAFVALRPPTDLPKRDESALLSIDRPAPVLSRFAPAPAIVVAIYPSLPAQAQALDRIALFVERAGAPHAQVLTMAEARETITSEGAGFDDLYQGHDYRAADTARFFATAAAHGIALTPAEAALRRSLARAGFLRPGADQALITLTGPGGPLDAPARAAILRHELAHGLYFTDRAYAAYVTSWWQTALSPAERRGIVQFLAGEGYDTRNDDLMRNEAQAYLIHTPDPRFFRPAAAGLTPARWQALRRGFIAGMPSSWLKTRTMP